MEKDICRFVCVQFRNKACYNGHIVSKEKEESLGLQINDKIYLVDGRYKRSTTKGLKIIAEYRAYPEWCTPELKEKYDYQTGKGTLFELI